MPAVKIAGEQRAKNLILFFPVALHNIFLARTDYDGNAL